VFLFFLFLRYHTYLVGGDDFKTLVMLYIVDFMLKARHLETS
jgi:hypothetical protein